MCCNTRSGPRAALTVFEDFTQKYVSQQAWHSLRAPSDGRNSIAAASVADIRSAARVLSVAIGADDPYEAWLRAELVKSRISGGATRQIHALAEGHGEIGQERALRRDSTGVSLAKAMGIRRSDVSFYPDRTFLSHMRSLPADRSHLLTTHSAPLSALPLSGLWAGPGSFAVLGRDAKTITLSDYDARTNTFEVRLLKFENDQAFGPATKFRAAGRHVLTRELFSAVL